MGGGVYDGRGAVVQVGAIEVALRDAALLRDRGDEPRAGALVPAEAVDGSAPGGARALRRDEEVDGAAWINCVLVAVGLDLCGGQVGPWYPGRCTDVRVFGWDGVRHIIFTRYLESTSTVTWAAP